MRSDENVGERDRDRGESEIEDDDRQQVDRDEGLEEVQRELEPERPRLRTAPPRELGDDLEHDREDQQDHGAAQRATPALRHVDEKRDDDHAAHDGREVPMLADAYRRVGPRSARAERGFDEHLLLEVVARLAARRGARALGARHERERESVAEKLGAGAR